MSRLRLALVLCCAIAATIAAISASPAAAKPTKAQAAKASKHAGKAAVRRAKRTLKRRGLRPVKSISCKARGRSRRSFRCRYRTPSCKGKVTQRRGRHARRWRLRVSKRCRKAKGSGAARYVSLFGFNDDAAKEGRVSADTEAGLAARAGATVQRTPLAWGGVEGEKGHFDWSTYDRLYAAYRAKGIRPLWAVQWAPPWARPGVSCPSSVPNCVPPQTPAYDGDWRNFVAMVTRRYPDSAGIEVWNEPNSGLYWGGAPNPERYAQVLRAAYSGVKSVSPSMPVILGGLADVGPEGVPAGSFLSRVLKAGGRGSMDAIGYHPYPSLPDPVNILRKRMNDFRSARDYAGAGSIPLWITETGASNAGASGYRPYGESAQAAALVDIYRELGTMSDVHAVVLHRLIDPQGGGIESGFGALHTNLSPKPAYCAVAHIRGKKAC